MFSFTLTYPEASTVEVAKPMDRYVVGATLAMALVSFSAFAQQIYSCGNGVYQQTPCPKGSSSKTIRYTPVPDSPPVQYHSTPPQAVEYSASPPAAAAAPQSRSAGGVIANPHGMSLQDKLRNIASDSAYKGSPSARRAAMNAALQEAGYQGAGDYQPPRPVNDQGIGRPANVIDSQTSMPINGAIKVAPNRIWDPSTGQYRNTY